MTKYIEIDRHFIREKIDNKKVCLVSILSAQQLADMFTKGLAGPKFHSLLVKLGMIYIYSTVRLRGSIGATTIGEPTRYPAGYPMVAADLIQLSSNIYLPETLDQISGWIFSCGYQQTGQNSRSINLDPTG